MAPEASLLTQQFFACGVSRDRGAGGLAASDCYRSLQRFASRRFHPGQKRRRQTRRLSCFPHFPLRRNTVLLFSPEPLKEVGESFRFFHLLVELSDQKRPRPKTTTDTVAFFGQNLVFLGSDGDKFCSTRLLSAMNYGNVFACN